VSLAESRSGSAGLIRRADEISLVTPEPEWWTVSNFRFMKSLPITFAPVAS